MPGQRGRTWIRTRCALIGTYDWGRTGRRIIRSAVADAMVARRADSREHPAPHGFGTGTVAMRPGPECPPADSRPEGIRPGACRDRCASGADRVSRARESGHGTARAWAPDPRHAHRRGPRAGRHGIPGHSGDRQRLDHSGGAGDPGDRGRSAPGHGRSVDPSCARSMACAADLRDGRNRRRCRVPRNRRRVTPPQGARLLGLRSPRGWPR